MLRNSFYEYGLVTKVLTYMIFSILLFMYISKGLNEFVANNFWATCYESFNLLLLIILIIKFFWYLINRQPLTIATSRWGAVLLNINTVLLFLLLFIFSIFTIVIFIINSYIQFELNINNKISYSFFNITIIPFSIIRLIGDVFKAYSCMDMLNIKFFLSKFNFLLFAVFLPLLTVLYLIQLYFYRRIKLERLPEGFK